MFYSELTQEKHWSFFGIGAQYERYAVEVPGRDDILRIRCQEGLWVGGSPHLTHWSPEYVVLRNTEGESCNFMNCEGWMIERWTYRLLSYGYIWTETLVSLNIHVVAFRVMALCTVVYGYAALTPRQYSLPKCWYPLVKLSWTDTIGYIPIMSQVT